MHRLYHIVETEGICQESEFVFFIVDLRHVTCITMTWFYLWYVTLSTHLASSRHRATWTSHLNPTLTLGQRLNECELFLLQMCRHFYFQRASVEHICVCRRPKCGTYRRVSPSFTVLDYNQVLKQQSVRLWSTWNHCELPLEKMMLDWCLS